MIINVIKIRRQSTTKTRNESRKIGRLGAVLSDKELHPEHKNGN